MKKKVWIRLIPAIVLVLAAIVGLFFYIPFLKQIKLEKAQQGQEVVIPQPKYKYPNGDTDPAHLADVLGSEEVYEKLASSKLLGWNPIEILNDPGSPPLGIPSTAWVTIHVMGYVTEISPKDGVITITNEGEQISFWVDVWEQILLQGTPEGPPGRNLDISEIREGDFVIYAGIFMNSTNLDLPEARGILIKARMEQVETEYKYQNGDTDPQHLAEVLGSQEAYQKLANSKLLISMLPLEILNDPGNPPTVWVVARMQGSIVDISPKEWIITITRPWEKGDRISFRIADGVQIYLKGTKGRPGRDLDISEIKKGGWGDYIKKVDIFINSTNLDLPEARSIYLMAREEIK